MKFTADLLSALLLSLSNLRDNTSESSALENVPANAVYIVPSNGPMLAATPTGSVAQAVFTHHPHHEPDREHEHDRHRNENHHPNNGEGEKGMKRPRAGQQRVRTRPLTSQKKTQSCPVPPILSCSAQAEETDTCCVSLVISTSVETSSPFIGRLSTRVAFSSTRNSGTSTMV